MPDPTNPTAPLQNVYETDVPPMTAPLPEAFPPPPTSTPPTTTLPPMPPPPPPTDPVPAPVTTNETAVTPPRPKKGLSKILIIGAILIAVLVGVYFLISKKPFGKGQSAQSGEIIWWGLWEDESAVAPLIAEYQTANPKVTIKYVRQSQQDYRERLTSALAKGTGPDIFVFHNSWTPMYKGSLEPLPAAVMGASDFAQTFYPVATSDLTSGTGILGIPAEYDALTLYVNDDLFAAAGLTPPATWDDLRTAAIALTKKDAQGAITQAGAALGRTENVDHWPEILALMMLQNGVDLGNPTGKLAEDALSYFTLFSTTDGVWDATLPASTAMFAGGKLAMYFGPSWRAFEISQLNPALKYHTVEVPQLPKASSSQQDLTYATYWANGVWNKSKNKTAAWDFLKFISSSDALAKIYANASSQRAFGEPYPRLDMAGLLTSHPILGSIIAKAPNAQSWYLQSRTFDGATGINSLINKYFEDAVNAVVLGTPPDKALLTVAQGVAQVLKQYGMAK